VINDWQPLLPVLRDEFGNDPVAKACLDRADHPPSQENTASVIAATRWYNQRKVSFLHDVCTKGTLKQTTRHVSREIPLVSKVYTDHKAALGSFKKLLMAYRYQHKITHWTRTYIFGLFKITTVNAFLIFRYYNPNASYCEFLEDLARALIRRAEGLEKLEKAVQMSRRILQQTSPSKSNAPR
jgi:hypothetical protein